MVCKVLMVLEHHQANMTIMLVLHPEDLVYVHSFQVKQWVLSSEMAFQ